MTSRQNKLLTRVTLRREKTIQACRNYRCGLGRLPRLRRKWKETSQTEKSRCSLRRTWDRSTLRAGDERSRSMINIWKTLHFSIQPRRRTSESTNGTWLLLSSLVWGWMNHSSSTPKQQRQQCTPNTSLECSRFLSQMNSKSTIHSNCISDKVNENPWWGL